MTRQEKIMTLIIMKGDLIDVSLHGDYGWALLTHPLNSDLKYLIRYDIDKNDPETWTSRESMLGYDVVEKYNEEYTFDELMDTVMY